MDTITKHDEMGQRFLDAIRYIMKNADLERVLGTYEYFLNFECRMVRTIGVRRRGSCDPR
jgi:hypothetical protein